MKNGHEQEIFSNLNMSEPDRDKINEKNDEMEAVKEEIEKFNEIKETLEALCERLGIENEELMVIKTKIEEE